MHLRIRRYTFNLSVVKLEMTIGSILQLCCSCYVMGPLTQMCMQQKHFCFECVLFFAVSVRNQ